MKRFLFPFLGLLVGLFGCKTKSDKTIKPEPQINTSPISMTGIDSLQLGITKAEVEAILDTTFKLKHIGIDSEPYDTFSAKYKGLNIEIYLYENSYENTVATLFGISSSDPACKTTAGIGVGSEKEKVIDTYADHLKYIAPVYETYPARSKTKSVVAVMDTVDTRATIFHILNRKVSSVEIITYYEFY